MISAPLLTAADILPLWPAIILAAGAILLLISEVSLISQSRWYQPLLAMGVTGLACAASLAGIQEAPKEVLLGFAILDPFGSSISAVVCVGAFLVVVSSAGFLHHREAERGEFYALVLFAAAGMSLFSLSGEWITLFINLEVMSIATYALAAYLRKGGRPAEAGFKYFLLGAFSSAVLLYGIALLYGATGTTKLTAMSYGLPAAYGSSGYLVLCGLSLVVAGFAFKVAAVPFHMWAPDVYEGAPAPVSGWMSAGVKAAAFAGLIRVFLMLGKGIDQRWPSLVFGALAFLTMVGGNLLAIPQRNVKRMLAYSSIAHAGYLLLGVAALFGHRGLPAGSLLGDIGAMPPDPGLGARADAIKGLVFYLLAYAVTAIGAFATVGALERKEEEERGTAWDLERFAGLAQRRPGWAFAMAAFMLSLGGIPPTVGFIAKLLIFRSAVQAGLVPLTVVAVLSSAAGVYYYLRVGVYLFIRPAPEGEPVPPRHWGTEVALWLSSAAVVGLGVVPGVIDEWISRAGQIWAP